jgi:hypothetical protein
LRLLAETLRHPQEVWEQWEWLHAAEKMALRRRYLAWWDVEGADKPGLSVFEWAPKRWWTGVTTFSPEDNQRKTALEYMAAQRVGVRRWPK